MKTIQNINDIRERISTDELELILMQDAYYGVGQPVVDQLINHYNEQTHHAQRITNRYALCPLKKNRHKLLIILWSCPLDLPYYIDGILSEKSIPTDFLHMPNTSIKLIELKLFLRSHKLPLPVYLFANEPDNSDRILRIPCNQYQEEAEIYAVKIPALQAKLNELDTIKPATMAERKERDFEIARLNKAIERLISPTANTRQLTHQSKQDHQEQAILDCLINLNYNPKTLPPNQGTKEV